MSRRNFTKGDYVKIAKDSIHEETEAIILYSADSNGIFSPLIYGLYIKQGQRINAWKKEAWYEECQLTLIGENRLDLLEEWLDK